MSIRSSVDHQETTIIMAPIVSRVVKLVSSGIGLGTEAYAAHKQTLRSPEGQLSRSEDCAATQSQGLPPRYVGVSPDEDEDLVDNGRAVPAAGNASSKLAPPDADHPANRRNSDDGDDAGPIDNDEHEWELDDTVHELSTRDSPPTYGHTASTRRADVDTLVAGFMAGHEQRQGMGELPCPVIIPQRRPGSKSRGFVRAYAPVLNDCGIDEKTFMDFNKTFHKSSQVSSRRP